MVTWVWWSERPDRCARRRLRADPRSWSPAECPAQSHRGWRRPSRRGQTPLARRSRLRPRCQDRGSLPRRRTPPHEHRGRPARARARTRRSTTAPRCCSDRRPIGSGIERPGNGPRRSADGQPGRHVAGDQQRRVAPRGHDDIERPPGKPLDQAERPAEHLGMQSDQSEREQREDPQARRSHRLPLPRRAVRLRRTARRRGRRHRARAPRSRRQPVGAPRHDGRAQHAR